MTGIAKGMNAANPFHVTDAECLARARSDLRMGLPIVLRSDNGTVLVAAAEIISASRLAAFVEDGTAALAITHWRARTLKVPVYDTDLARIALPSSISRTKLHDIIDPADDLGAPMKGPFATRRGGDATLARAGLALAKTAQLLPAVLIRDSADIPPGLTVLDTDTLHDGPAKLHPVIAAGLPMRVSHAGRLQVFRPDDGGVEHYAVEIGRHNHETAPLVRLHSACFTGDILGSLKCDCGPQLNGALAQMAAAESGVLLYLNQEGRGIGLANKMRAYALQDQGFDTVDANHRLGFEDDERDFRIGAAILRRMGIGAVRLLTNNPRKVDMLIACGLDVVERIPLWVGENPLNTEYLQTKSEKSGHLK